MNTTLIVRERGWNFYMPTWLTILLALGGSAAISTIVGLIINKIVKKAQQKQEQFQQLKQKELDLKEKEQELKLEKEIMEEISELLLPLNSKMDSIKEQLDLDRAATITGIRSNLKVLRDQYTKQGFADIGDKATWKELYENYRNMGGNHFKEYVDQWKDEVELLPTEKKVRVKNK